MHPVQMGGNVNISDHPTVTKSALEDSVHILTIYPSNEDKCDLLTFFFNIRQKIKDKLAERCDKVKHVKWYLNVHVEFSRETNEGEVDNTHPYFKSGTYILLSKNDIRDDDINEAFQKQFKSFDEYIARGSGWTLKQVMFMELQTIQFRPIGSGEDIIEFDDYSKQMRVPFVIYCDFEAFARPLDTCYPNSTQSSSTATVNYDACGYGYQVVCENERHSGPCHLQRTICM
ncbi:unnamed protein product [Mytilus coruscus]|uniref:Uncharacterized protein n=1 Tax=Mytilus coruscus TaxID=42192 RepID=A0A6J8B5T8_MYTCO|nr:unnamed protein product [Mytilus coruscus]